MSSPQEAYSRCHKGLTLFSDEPHPRDWFTFHYRNPSGRIPEPFTTSSWDQQRRMSQQRLVQPLGASGSVLCLLPRSGDPPLAPGRPSQLRASEPGKRTQPVEDHVPLRFDNRRLHPPTKRAGIYRQCVVQGQYTGATKGWKRMDKAARRGMWCVASPTRQVS